MIVTKEDRIFKSLALLCVFFGFGLNYANIDPEYKLAIILPMVAVLTVLAVRKYMRDKRDGKALKRYYLALGVLLLSVLILLSAIYIIG